MKKAAASLPPPFRWVSRRLARPRSPQLDAFRKPEVSSTGSSDSQSYRPLHITSFLSPQIVANPTTGSLDAPNGTSDEGLAPRSEDHQPCACVAAAADRRSARRATLDQGRYGSGSTARPFTIVMK